MATDKPETKQQPLPSEPMHVTTNDVEPDATLDAAIDETIKRSVSIVHAAAKALLVDPKKLCDLLRNVWRTTKGQPPLTDQEMFAGLSIIARFGLDPIAREVYVTRDATGRLLTIVAIDGWIKILDRCEHYDGFDMELHENDEHEIDWVECKIYSKLRSHPSIYRAYAHEYAEVSGFVAKKIPLHMLRLFALRHAARLFVPLGAPVMLEEEAIYAANNSEHSGKRGARVSRLSPAV